MMNDATKREVEAKLKKEGINVAGWSTVKDLYTDYPVYAKFSEVYRSIAESTDEPIVNESDDTDIFVTEEHYAMLEASVNATTREQMQIVVDKMLDMSRVAIRRVIQESLPTEWENIEPNIISNLIEESVATSITLANKTLDTLFPPSVKDQLIALKARKVRDVADREKQMAILEKQIKVLTDDLSALSIASSVERGEIDDISFILSSGLTSRNINRVLSTTSCGFIYDILDAELNMLLGIGTRSSK